MPNEQDIPIDIHLNKLLDWLISRRHCLRNWQKHVLLVRQNINNAIQDMPAVTEVAELLAGTYINYYHCRRIIDILKETEASSKNIFGLYSSKRMKDWQEIVRLYEKDNVYLAEAAQLLVRNITYEIPSLKKQLSKCKQLQEESLRKEADCVKNANLLREHYFASCSQIGIEGKNIKKELIHLLEELPHVIAPMVLFSKKLASSADYYASFLNFTLQSNVEKFYLPVIKHIINRGDTTVYEMRTGELPDVIQINSSAMPLDDDNGSNGEADDKIDFGDFGAPSESGDDRSSISPNGDFVHVERDEYTLDHPGIEDSITESILKEWDITVESPETFNTESANGVKVAKGTDALTVLEAEETRSKFYCELLELQTFLEQRLLEAKSEGDVLLSNQYQSASFTFQEPSIDSIHMMLTNVKEILSMLMQPKFKHLVSIKESPRYVDRLADSLKTKLDAAERMSQCQKVYNLKYKETCEEEKVLVPKINLIIEKTKELLHQIEKDISKHYKNRPVNIMGGIISLQFVDV